MGSKKRDIQIDIIRCIAFLLVISEHFFVWNGYYQMKTGGTETYIFCVLRTISIHCIPLFMMISGYLLSGRVLFPITKKYIYRLIDLLVIYLFCTFILIFFRIVFLNESMDIWDIIKNITSFSQYSWYMAMYTGLYLIIPFLNILLKNINDKRDVTVLIIILLFISTIPSAINIKEKIVPEMWSDLYPVACYFTGAYIRKYGQEIKRKKAGLLAIWLSMAFCIGTLDYWLYYGRTFTTGVWNDVGSFWNIIMAFLLFLILIKADFKHIKISEKFLKKLSDLIYAAFMLSYISDVVVWKIFKDIIPVSNKLLIYIPSVFISFGMAMIMSWVFNIAYGKLKGLLFGVKR